MLLMVFLFTRPAIFSAYNLKDQGSLGDAINGLTAPIIGLVTAGLLFYSFKAQTEANNLLRSQNHFDTYIKLFSQLESVVSKYEYQFVTQADLNTAEIPRNFTKLKNGNFEITLTGANAIRAFATKLNSQDKIDEFDPNVSNLSVILEDVVLLFRFAETAPEENAEYCFMRLNHFIQANLSESYFYITDRHGSENTGNFGKLMYQFGAIQHTLTKIEAAYLAKHNLK